MNLDASFSYQIKKEVTKPLYAGQYFIVVQHPMQNNRFDVYPGGLNGQPTMTADSNGGLNVWTLSQAYPSDYAKSTNDFELTGANSLQGSNAAEALVEAINSANVDDSYTNSRFSSRTRSSPSTPLATGMSVTSSPSLQPPTSP